MSKKTLSVILTIIFTLALSGCKNEDFFYETPSYEGPVSLTLDLSFNPLAEGVVTRGVDANLDFELRDLTVLFYDSQANEETGIPAKYFSYSNLTTEQEERVSDTEPHTRHTKVTMTMESGGSYRIYAVANVADNLSESDFSTISEKTLREKVIDWPTYSENTSLGPKNPLRYSIPDAMFGYFHVATNSSHDAEHKGEAGTASQDIIHHDTSYDFKTNVNRPAPIALNMSEITIHAWMKRVISRLTVGFDGSQLNRGVEIYIKSVHIKDAVKSCLLGHDNKAVALTDLLQYDATDQRLNHIYSSLEGAEGDAITKTKPYYPRNPDTDKATDYDDWYDYVHGDAASLDPKDPEPGAYTPVSLYFMENIQGKVANYNGPKEYPKAYALDYRSGSDYDKDNKPYGTYLEVEAYYRNTRKASQGKIIYRFMLGQNVTDDFNAERNRHYKLVLRFKGEANDVDWHIDYQEEKPYFRIPYNLGDEDADFAFKDEANDETWFKNENWNRSYVWYAYDENHNPIAEICKELIYYDDNYSDTDVNSHKFYQVVTVYPIGDDGITDLTKGIIAQVLDCDDPNETAEKFYTKKDGAKISMNYRYEFSDQYTSGLDKDKAKQAYYTIKACELTTTIANGGNEADRHDNYLYVAYNTETKELSLIEKPLQKCLETRPYRVSDKDGNGYPIVKIGSAYWFRENMRTKSVFTANDILGLGYNSPTQINPYHEGVESNWEGAECVYFHEKEAMYKTLADDPDGSKYGLLYNLGAVAGSAAFDAWTTNEGAYPGCDGYGCGVLIGLEDQYIDFDLSSNPYLYELNDWQLPPKGWHIPTGATDRMAGPNNIRGYGHIWQDHQYLLFYLDMDYFRATADKGSLKWPATNYSINTRTKKNLSGLSLLAIPVDGQSTELSCYIDSNKRNQGDISGVMVPYWTTSLVYFKPDSESDYGLFAFPPIFDNTMDRDCDKAGKLFTDEYYEGKSTEKFFKRINASYMHVRPCRNSFRESYAAQPWSVLGDLWKGEE